jgi:hypothetical protein
MAENQELEKRDETVSVKKDQFIVDYIRALNEKGHDVSFIKHDLQKKGYSEEVVEEIIPIITDQKKPEMIKPEDFDKDVQVEEHRYRVGHAPENTHKKDSAHEKVQQRDHTAESEEPHYHIQKRKPQQQKISFNELIFMILYGIFMIFLIGWTSIKTEVSLAVIFFSFLPTLITIIASFFFFQAEPRFKIIVWVVPLFLCVIFYGAVSSGVLSLLRNIDLGNVTVFNFILSMVYILILDFFNHLDKSIITPIEKKVIKAEKRIMHDEHRMRDTLIREDAKQPDMIYRKTTKKHGPEEIDKSKEVTVKGTTQELQGYVRSIEDTSKAINFTIGRVYSNKRGGKPELRDKIKIDSTWYNLIAEISREGVDTRLPELRNVIYQIGARLNVLYLTEKQVFGSQAIKRLNGIERDEEGNDKIIDVLVKNDKDPVALYYQTAVDYCNKAVQDIDIIMAQPKYHISGDAHIVK